MYSIGQISEMFNLPISTIRYYDKEGLFPQIERQSGIRKFSDAEVEALRVIECLKASGLEIREIKQFMEWTTEGSATYAWRKQLFETRKAAVEEEITQLQKTLAMLKYKCWYYETAIHDGNEDRINEMLPDNLPPEIQALYDLGHT
jgi:DNA-binding transcriptional MerR regulator